MINAKTLYLVSQFSYLPELPVRLTRMTDTLDQKRHPISPPDPTDFLVKL